MEQSPSSGANKSSASQEILGISQKLGISYFIYKGPSTAPH